MKKQKTARQSSDAEPEGADCGKECSLAAEQVRDEMIVQLCSDSLCRHELRCVDTQVCQVACQCIILWLGFCTLYVVTGFPTAVFVELSLLRFLFAESLNAHIIACR